MNSVMKSHFYREQGCSQCCGNHVWSCASFYGCSLPPSVSYALAHGESLPLRRKEHGSISVLWPDGLNTPLVSGSLLFKITWTKVSLNLVFNFLVSILNILPLSKIWVLLPIPLPLWHNLIGILIISVSQSLFELERVLLSMWTDTSELVPRELDGCYG